MPSSSSSTSSSPVNVGSRLVLPCGSVLPNRVIKAAMTECLADPGDNLPTAELVDLYSNWAKSGLGGCITGNVMVDRRYLENPGNVALEAIDEQPQRLALYQRWATAIKQNKSLALVQLSHPGRQTPVSVSSRPLAPSAVKLQLALPSFLAPVATPVEATTADINEIVERFATSARLAVAAGFDGVQIHSAHGYLLSQFLSPKVNLRQDEYGGSSENRRRLLLQVVDSVRQAVGPKRVVAVKLNSADFQKGGFSEEESLQVIQELYKRKVDFVEISGGTYEKMTAMQGVDTFVRESTRVREAFFIEFADKLRAHCPDMISMLTGGWRSASAMHNTLQAGRVDIIGLARPLCVIVTFPQQCVDYSNALAQDKPTEREPVFPSYHLHVNVGIQELNKTLDTALENYWHQGQMRRIARGESPDLNLGGWWYMLSFQFIQGYYWDYRRNRAKSAAVVTTLAAALSSAIYFYLQRKH